MEVLSFYIGAFLLVLFCTAFVKLLTALSIFRYGLGLDSAPFGLVVLALSLVLSFFVMEPQLKSATGLQSFMNGSQLNTENIEASFSPFLLKHTEVKFTDKLNKIAEKSGSEHKDTFALKLSAFMLSELSSAFLIGLIVILPFLIIDLLIANAMAALNITSLSTAVVSLPVKLLLFVALDGWLLISEKLLGGYF